MKNNLTSGLVAVLPLLVTSIACAQANFTNSGYAENFDGLISAGTVTGAFSSSINTQAAVPNLSGWQAAKISGSSSSASAFTASDGSGNSGLVYSYGSTGSGERALGILASGSNVFAMGPSFVNATDHTITSVTVRFTAEFWRSSTTLQNTLTFAYGVKAADDSGTTSGNYLTSSGLTAFPALDIVGPAPVATNGSLNGNLVANQKSMSVLLDNLNWEPGQVLYLRWTDVDDGGSDAGMAIDNFFLSEGVYVDPNDVSRGTANALFTPTSFAGNPFAATNNAVFDGVAGTTTLSGAVVANSLKFTTDGHVLAGTASDSVSLTSGVVDVSGTATATISGIVAGSAGLQKSGTGTLVLSGANTFTGAITIAAGRLQIGDETALGNADNDLVFVGTLATAGNLSLGVNRALSGSGAIETGASGTLTIAGPLSGAGLSISGATTVALNGATNSASSLSFAEPVALSVATGNLAVTSSLNFNQSSGTSTVTGGLNFGTGATTLSVANGTLAPAGTFTAAITTTSRITKSGAGTLDLTGTTFSGTGAFRLGIQGSFPAEGGKILVNDATDLGTLQTQFNSGTIEATVPLSFAGGLSIGGRTLPASISRAVLAGSNMVFSGTSGFFSASGGSGQIGVVVNNHTTLSGAFTATTAPTSAAPDPIGVVVNVSGTGALTISGDASLVLDKFYVNGGVELNVTGTLGGEQLNVDAGSTLTGGGTFSGAHIPANASATPTPIPELYRSSTATFYAGSTLAPTGTFAFLANLTLESGSSTVLSIDGPVIDTGYDSVDVSIPSGAVSSVGSYTLSYGGDLILSFGATAQNGAYNLFTTGANVTRSGSFSTVSLTGSYTGTLSGPSGGVWSGTAGGKTFSFDESTGVLTVSGGLSAIETWRQTYFGTTANSGTTANTADYDGDGISNLLEYATGGDPTVAGVSLVTQGKSGDFLTLSFPVIGDSAITYTVQASNDLASGFAAVTGGSFNDAGGVRTYTDDVSLATPGARRFLRLQVTAAAE